MGPSRGEQEVRSAISPVNPIISDKRIQRTGQSAKAFQGLCQARCLFSPVAVVSLNCRDHTHHATERASLFLRSAFFLVMCWGGIGIAPVSGQEAIYATNGRVEQSLGQQGPGSQMVVRLPSAYASPTGEIDVVPNVEVASGEPLPAIGSDGMPTRFRAAALQSGATGPGGPAPRWNGSAVGVPASVPVFEDLVAGNGTLGVESELMPGPMPNGMGKIFMQDPFEGPRVGHERLAYALFEMDPAQPFSNFRIRASSTYGHVFPDRAETFWARTVDGKGPRLPETGVDYQDLRFRLEMGSKAFSTAIEAPFRSLNPEVNSNHTGLSDLQLTIKTVLIDGQAWLVTMYFGSYFPTGSAIGGMSTGHVSLEPGLLLRYKWRESTWLHGQLKYWFPAGGHPTHSGQVLGLGFGASHVWRETDCSAIVPSLELMSHSVQDGQERTPLGVIRRVDGTHVFQVVPGVHYVLDRGADFGLLEYGLSMVFPISSDQFYDTKLSFDIRWSY